MTTPRPEYVQVAFVGGKGGNWSAQGFTTQPDTTADRDRRRHRNAVVKHHNGVPWFEAPIPEPDHTCTQQSVGLVDQKRVQRCACGAIRIEIEGRTGIWIHQNSRTPEPILTDEESDPGELAASFAELAATSKTVALGLGRIIAAVRNLARHR